MSEIKQNSELCASCPKRSLLSKAVAKLILAPEQVSGCEGYINVAHGSVITQYRAPGEPSPDEHTWTSMSSSATGERWYSRIQWESTKTCGNEEIKPGDEEVEYGFGDEQRAKDGHKVRAFVSGDEHGIRDMKFALAMMHMDDGLDT